MFITISCVVYIGGLPHITRTSQILFLSGYLFALVCLAAVYGGNLMAYLAIEKLVWPFRTLQEFADSDYGIYVSEGGVTESRIKVNIYLCCL